MIKDIFRRLPLMRMFQNFVSDIFRSTKRDLLILDRFFWNGEICSHNLFLVDAKRKELKQLELPTVSDSDMGFKVIGTCNGLVCVTHYSFDQTSCLFIWNPASMQTKRILEPHNAALLPYKVPPNCLIGFYFNNNSSDYEVVRLHSFEDMQNTCLDDSLNKICALKVEKYSVRSGSWRGIECCGPLVTVNGTLFWTENCVSLKGTLLWIAMEISEKVSHEMIISFNFYHNVIGKIEFPFSNKGCSELYKKVEAYNDSVALLICSEDKCNEKFLDLWVFHDKYDGVGCWTKIYTIGKFSSLERPVGIWKNEVLMSAPRVIHNGRVIIALLQEDALADEFSYNIFNYVESFVHF